MASGAFSNALPAGVHVQLSYKPAIQATAVAAGGNTAARWIRAALFTAAAGTIIFGLASPTFRDDEGALKGSFVVAIAAALSLSGAALAAGRAEMRAALWGALALMGQAAALQMIDAGVRIHYQHYDPLRSNRIPALVLFCIQACIVAAGAWPHARAAANWLRRNFRFWRLAAIVAGGLAFAAPVSRDRRSFALELAFGALVQTINFLNLALAVAAIPKDSAAGVQSRLRRLMEGGDRTGKLRFGLWAALAVTIAASALSYFVYERHPHIPDEVAYIYHARYFAAGALSLPSPPAPEAINIDLMNYEKSRWFSPVPPGWPAVLAIGEWPGVPWLVNPLLAGLNVFLTYLLLVEIAPRATARMAVLLLCISPWHVFMSMNFMTHTLTMTCLVAGLLGVAWSRRTGSFWPALLAGAAVGFGSLVRPLDGLIAGTLIAAWAAGVGGRRLRLTSLIALGAAAAGAASLTLPYNKLLTGDPFKAPIMAYMDKYYGPKSNAMGFGPERGVGWPLDPYPGHTLFESFINDDLNLFSVNVELFGWATGSLFIIMLAIFGRRICALDGAMLAAIFVVLSAYTFYWYSGGPDFGARYWYIILIPCIVLAVSGVQALEEKLAGTAMAGRAMLLVVAMCTASVTIYMPWRALDKYRHYLFMRPDVRELAKQLHFGRSLVLVRGQRHPDYASAAIYNPLDFRSDATVYAWDGGANARAEALEAYRGRPVWILEGPTITGKGFRVVSGPVPSERTVR